MCVCVCVCLKIARAPTGSSVQNINLCSSRTTVPFSSLPRPTLPTISSLLTAMLLSSPWCRGAAWCCWMLLPGPAPFAALSNSAQATASSSSAPLARLGFQAPASSGAALRSRSSSRSGGGGGGSRSINWGNLGAGDASSNGVERFVRYPCVCFVYVCVCAGGCGASLNLFDLVLLVPEWHRAPDSSRDEEGVVAKPVPLIYGSRTLLVCIDPMPPEHPPIHACQS